MDDQAKTLRTMVMTMPPAANSSEDFQSVPKGNAPKMRCLAISGGKGGIGKSVLAVNLALELGALGNHVSLLDADFGLANADLICGVTPKYHLGHVVSGVKTLEEIEIKLSDSVNLIPGGSAVEELANYFLKTDSDLFEQLQSLDDRSDFLLIDTAAGIAENVLGVLVSAAEVVIVVTPDPTSIVNAYATIKVLLRHCPQKPISVVVNNAVGVGDGEQVFQQISQAVKGFLNYQMRFIGMIPHDAQMQSAIREQIPIVRYAPQSPSSRAIRLIARQLHKQSANGLDFPVSSESFWNVLSGN